MSYSFHYCSFVRESSSSIALADAAVAAAAAAVVCLMFCMPECYLPCFEIPRQKYSYIILCIVRESSSSIMSCRCWWWCCCFLSCFEIPRANSFNLILCIRSTWPRWCRWCIEMFEICESAVVRYCGFRVLIDLWHVPSFLFSGFACIIFVLNGNLTVCWYLSALRFVE